MVIFTVYGYYFNNRTQYTICIESPLEMNVKGIPTCIYQNG